MEHGFLKLVFNISDWLGAIYKKNICRNRVNTILEYSTHVFLVTVIIQ